MSAPEMAGGGRLVRPGAGEGRVLAGVCASLANAYGLSVVLVRALFLLFAIFGVGEIVYIVLWVVTPMAGRPRLQ